MTPAQGTHHSDGYRRRSQQRRNCVAKRIRSGPKQCFDLFPTDVLNLLLDVIRSFGIDENQHERKPGVLRLQSLHRMRALLPTVLYFDVFLKQYAEDVHEVDALYPASNWDAHEYRDHSAHSPVLLRTIARSSGSQLRTLRLPLYECVGAETILPTVLYECDQLHSLEFDDSGRVDERIATQLAASRIRDLSVNRPGIHTMHALRDGLKSLKRIRLCNVERAMVGPLRSLFSLSCLAQVESVQLEFCEQCGVMVCSGGGGDESDQVLNARYDVMGLFRDMGANLAQWLPNVQTLAMSTKSAQHFMQQDTELTRRDITAMNGMGSRMMGCWSLRSAGKEKRAHDKVQKVQLSSTSAAQLQKMQEAFHEACAAAEEVELDIGGYGMLVRAEGSGKGAMGAGRVFVTKAKLRPLMILRLVGGGDEANAISEQGMVREVSVHFDEVMGRYSRQLRTLWSNYAGSIERASMRWCVRSGDEKEDSDTEREREQAQLGRLRNYRMVADMAVRLGNVREIEVSMCGVTECGYNDGKTRVAGWLMLVLRRGLFSKVRHVHVVECRCGGAVRSFVSNCAKVVAMLCRLPSLESVHVGRTTAAEATAVAAGAGVGEVKEVEAAMRDVEQLRSRHAAVSLGGVAAALGEWGARARCATAASSTAVSVSACGGGLRVAADAMRAAEK